MSVVVPGVTEDNKNDVCNSFAVAVDGEVTYCSLSGPSGRRNLQANTLYMDIAVDDVSLATSQIESADFTSSLKGLPPGVSVSTIELGTNRHVITTP